VGQFYGYDARGDSDNPISHDHDKRSQELPNRSKGVDVTIAHGGEGNHGPVNAPGDTGESCLGPLDDEHHGPYDHHDGQDGEEEDDNLVATGPKSRAEGTGLSDILGQFQDSEDPQYPENSDDDEILSSRKKEAQIGGEHSQQVDDSEEAEGVV